MPQEVSFAPEQIQPHSTPPPVPGGEVSFSPEQIQPQGATGGPPQPQMAISHAPSGPPPAPTTGRSPVPGRGTEFVPGRSVFSPETERIIGGTVGGVAATALLPELGIAAGPWVPGLIRGGIQAATSAVGAAAGGGATAAAQGKPEEAPGAAGEQAAYALGGEAASKFITWPLRRFFAFKAGNEASQAYERLKGAFGAVSPAKVGQDVEAVAQGPAKHSLDQLGQNVEAAAKSGPAVDWRGVKDSVNSMAEKMTPVASHEQPQGVGYLNNARAQGGATAGEQSRYAKALADAGVQLPPEHPLPGALGKIQEAPDQVSFEDAHKYKRMLDDAINWDRRSSKQIQGVTKATRQAVRSSMSGHAPYDEATAAYKAAAPLFQRGIVAQLHKGVIDNPERIVSLIKGNEPTKLGMLFDVLDTHAAQGGGAAEGEAAKNAVRSAWTFQKLIKPGIENVGTNIAKMDPAFAARMYGDSEGQAVLGNLQKIGAAMRVVGAEPDIKQAGLAVAHVSSAPHSPWAWRHIASIFHGPQGPELVQWAAHSSMGTQAIVKAITGPQPGQALSALMQTVFGGGPEEDNSGPPVPPK